MSKNLEKRLKILKKRQNFGILETTSKSRKTGIKPFKLLKKTSKMSKNMEKNVKYIDKHSKM